MRKHLPAIAFGALFGCLFDVLVVAFWHGIESPIPWSGWSAIPLFAFGTLWGPIALPFASVLAFPKGSFPRSLESWDAHGLRVWLGRGLVFGALLSWPLLLIPAASVELGQPHLKFAMLSVPIAGALSMIGLIDRVRTAPRSSAPRGRATIAIALHGLLLPWCLALMTPNPIWRVDPSFEDSLAYEPEEAVRVEPVDAFFWTPGMNLITPSGSTYISAPIALTSRTFVLHGRILMPFVYGGGALYIPLGPGGRRLDDSLLDRLLARTRFERFGVLAFLPFMPFFTLVILRTHMPTDAGLVLVYAAMLLAVWWVWSGV